MKDFSNQKEMSTYIENIDDFDQIEKAIKQCIASNFETKPKLEDINIISYETIIYHADRFRTGIKVIFEIDSIRYVGTFTADNIFNVLIYESIAKY